MRSGTSRPGGPGAPADGRDCLRLPAEVAAARTARTHVRRMGSSWPVEALEIVQLLASELVTNAVRYGGEPIDLCVRATSSGLLVEVIDGSPEPPRLEQQAPHWSKPSGRGLHIVEALADRWGVTPSSDPPGKTVWFVVGTSVDG